MFFIFLVSDKNMCFYVFYPHKAHIDILLQLYSYYVIESVSGDYKL